MTGRTDPDEERGITALIEHIQEAGAGFHRNPVPLDDERAREIAVHLASLGYDRVYIINDREKLDLLPVGSVVRETGKHTTASVWERFLQGWLSPGSTEHETRGMIPQLPVIVLY
jgi:hypothetical protein